MKTVKIGLIDILKLAGLESTPQTRLVRHQTREMEEVRRGGWLELYQRYQRRPVFHTIKQIVSFYGLSGTRAGFYGVYKVLGHHPASKGDAPALCQWSPRWQRTSRFFYDLERDPRFDDLRDRLVIDWGPAVRSWVQKPNDKPVLEVLEPGRTLPPFDDYLGFTLSYAELKALFKPGEAHRDWRVSLSAVAGVYLILDEGSGQQYVGSAYGVDGIWGRWREYAKSGDGGNAKLRALLKHDPHTSDRFRFSVLQTLPKTMVDKEVIWWEGRHKRKLGTRAIGLNLN